MTVYELIKELVDYNPNDEVEFRLTGGFGIGETRRDFKEYANDVDMIFKDIKESKSMDNHVEIKLEYWDW